MPAFLLRSRKNDELIYIGQVILEEHSLPQYPPPHSPSKMLFHVHFSKLLPLCTNFISSFSVSAFSGPLKSTFLDDLQKNKNGIHVSTETDFGKVDLGGRKKLTVWIQNKGETNQVFLRAHLPAECTQIKVQGLYSHSLCK